MLAAGVIEQGDGAWGFPAVLVKKKDGEVRFRVDYRALNTVKRKDVYPLPRIDETLEALGGALLFSTLDLKAGYWGLTWITCLVYLDDIILYTRGGIERHIVELACVLERLTEAGLTLKLKKCVFATRKTEYLGHALSSDGVRPLERLVSAARQFPQPRDEIEVKRLAHLVGYYRRFIENFGSVMAPMTKLLRKSLDWDWPEAQQMAFEHVKMMLTTQPLQIYPDFNLPFRVVTDVSTIGLGACLTQDRGDGRQPVASASDESNAATTSPAWSTTATAGVGSATTTTAMRTVMGGEQSSSPNVRTTTRMTGTATVADHENTVSMGTRRSTRRCTGTPTMTKQTRDTNLSVVQEQHERRGDIDTSVGLGVEQAALVRRSPDVDEAAHADDETRPLEQTTKPLAPMMSGARREQAGAVRNERAARKQIRTSRGVNTKRYTTSTTAISMSRSEALRRTPAESREVRADRLMELHDENPSGSANPTMRTRREQPTVSTTANEELRTTEATGLTSRSTTTEAERSRTNDGDSAEQRATARK
ncbi:unnamed protein product [Phytophthora fragariaefolia]|uniref:Unnamed protein product n=1 Tax=Phytophthora fragariaefolia TaxID=1490495 RepID=A0A9W6XS64_9STRA|nr:unnamed protein product [Phytophthora fragariaefolia]